MLKEYAGKVFYAKLVNDKAANETDHRRGRSGEIWSLQGETLDCLKIIERLNLEEEFSMCIVHFCVLQHTPFMKKPCLCQGTLFDHGAPLRYLNQRIGRGHSFKSSHIEQRSGDKKTLVKTHTAVD